MNVDELEALATIMSMRIIEDSGMWAVTDDKQLFCQLFPSKEVALKAWYVRVKGNLQHNFVKIWTWNK